MFKIFLETKCKPSNILQADIHWIKFIFKQKTSLLLYKGKVDWTVLFMYCLNLITVLYIYSMFLIFVCKTFHIYFVQSCQTIASYNVTACYLNIDITSCRHKNIAYHSNSRKIRPFGRQCWTSDSSGSHRWVVQSASCYSPRLTHLSTPRCPVKTEWGKFYTRST